MLARNFLLLMTLIYLTSFAEATVSFRLARFEGVAGDGVGRIFVTPQSSGAIQLVSSTINLTVDPVVVSDDRRARGPLVLNLGADRTLTISSGTGPLRQASYMLHIDGTDIPLHPTIAISTRSTVTRSERPLAPRFADPINPGDTPDIGHGPQLHCQPGYELRTMETNCVGNPDQADSPSRCTERICVRQETGPGYHYKR